MISRSVIRSGGFLIVFLRRATRVAWCFFIVSAQSRLPRVPRLKEFDQDGAGNPASRGHISGEARRGASCAALFAAHFAGAEQRHPA
jgi:hypothetical protein